METDSFEKQIVLTPDLCGRCAGLSPLAAFTIFQGIASEHAERIGVGGAAMAKRGEFWLTVHSRVDFYEPAYLMDALTAQTWPERCEGRDIRCFRSYRLTHGEKTVALGRTQWAILGPEGKIQRFEQSGFPADFPFPDAAAIAEPPVRFHDELTQDVGYEKRAAFVDLYFNVIGTILFLCGFYGLNALIGFAFFNETANTFGIAIVHTIFNVVTTAILLPFNRLLEKLAILTVPDSPSDKKQENTLLDERLLTTPSVAVGRAMLTGSDMAEICRTALLQAMSTTRVWNDAIADEVLRKEDAVDHYEDVLGTYLVKLSAKHLSVDDNRTVNTLLHTIGDFERVSDHAVNIIKTAEEIRDKDIKFSEEALNDLSVLEAAVQDIVNRTVDAFQKCDTYAAGKIEPLEQVVDGLVREVKTRHIARLQAGVCTIEYGFVLDDLLTNYERIADHCSNIAVAMIEVAEDKFDTHEYLANVKHGGSVKFERRYEKYRGRYTFPPEAYSEPAENPAEN